MNRLMKQTTLTAAMMILIAGCESTPAPRIQQVEQARAAYEAGRYIRSEQMIDQFLRSRSKGAAAAEAYYIRGLSRIKTGNRSGAKRDIQTGHRMTDDNELKAMMAVQLGNFDFDDERYNSAMVHYESAIRDLPEADPKDKALYRLAVSRFRVGQFDDGRATLADLVRRFPNSSLAGPAQRLKNWDGDYYTVQCGAFNNPAHAARAARDLRRRGFVTRTYRDRTGAARHVVRVGRFRTYSDARAMLDRVRRYQSDAFILP